MITYFDPTQIEGIDLPEKFTFPFFYQPHKLTEIAALDLQNYLHHQDNFEHNFGLDSEQKGLVIGKMFGVLIVKDTEGKLGYLSAFSGKLGGTNTHVKFVPPVFDMLTENSFFLREIEILNSINSQVEQIESDSNYLALHTALEEAKQQAEQQISAQKQLLKENKSERKRVRQASKNVLSSEEYVLLEADLIKQSLRDKHEFRVVENYWQEKIQAIESGLYSFEQQIELLKKERKEKSSELQQQLFEQYSFLNKYGKSKSIGSIFSDTIFGKPPAGAGECATPKLLQYAFLNDYEPIAMAEFWWGASPKSEIRKHKQFYPACTGKCEPILKHMLEGIELDENPLLKNLGEGKQLEIIYEDAYVIVVNKPNELLSVPGINIQDSVYTRLKYQLHLEPLIIHRLDMPTSGLLVVAKTKDAHKNIQKQFLRRTVKKRYTALLDGIVAVKSGMIKLPLLMDIEDRPRQLVCFEQGKKAITEYQVISEQDGKTKIHFYPHTGRTHQLRMHASHHLGLNAPIVGDDLYGTSADRLYLQASLLEFAHPITQEIMRFEIEEEF